MLENAKGRKIRRKILFKLLGVYLEEKEVTNKKRERRDGEGK